MAAFAPRPVVARGCATGRSWPHAENQRPYAPRHPPRNCQPNHNNPIPRNRSAVSNAKGTRYSRFGQAVAFKRSCARRSKSRYRAPSPPDRAPRCGRSKNRAACRPIAVPSIRTVVSAGCVCAAKSQIAEAQHREPFRHRDPARERLGQHAVREHVGAAIERVDLRMCGQQSRQSESSIGQRTRRVHQRARNGGAHPAPSSGRRNHGDAGWRGDRSR